MTDISALQPEIDRLAELHQQMEALKQLQQQAQAALLLRMKFKVTAGEFGDNELAEVYTQVRGRVAEGFHDQWNATLPTRANSAYVRAANKAKREARAKLRAVPNGPSGTWTGTFPFDRNCPMPPKGTSVVYLLYRKNGPAVYVGSTSHLEIRLAAHARQGKVFDRWTAVPCLDRASAYQLEDQLLRDHKLTLNARAAR